MLLVLFGVYRLPFPFFVGAGFDRTAADADITAVFVLIVVFAAPVIVHAGPAIACAVVSGLAH